MKKLLCFVLVFMGSYVCAANEEKITLQVFTSNTNENALYEGKVFLGNSLKDVVDEVNRNNISPRTIILKNETVATVIIVETGNLDRTVRAWLASMPGSDRIVVIGSATGYYIKGDSS